MGDNIELQSFYDNTTKDESDIEEYHEINPDNVRDAVITQSFSSPIKEFDFFTQYDAKPSQKISQKKKKKSKEPKGRESNLMDIINTELASVAVPISDDNIITTVDNEEYSRNYGYLVRTPSLQDLFRKSKPLRLFDSEYGWGLKQNPVRLSPIFPRVLENAVVEDYSIPVQYVDPVSFDDLNLQKSNASQHTDRFLDITIKDIRFSYHHSFSLETMICAKLIENYNHYNVLTKELTDLSKEIKVIRETRLNLKQQFLKISPSKKADIRFDETLRKYTKKQIVLKEKYQEALKNQRKILHNVISLWSDMQMIREKIGCTDTPYHLDIENKELDQKQFEDEWAETFNIEFNDMLDKIEFEYVTKYIEYKEMKNGQNKEHPEKQKVSKPKLSIDEESLKKEVEEIVNNLVPTEKTVVYLKKSERIPPILTFPYQLEIFVDKVFVCRSEACTVENEFTFSVEFSESFSVQILPNNEIITVVLLEDSESVSFIEIELKDIRQNITVAEYTVKNFDYNNLLIHPNLNRVGTGHSIKEIAKASKVRLKSSNIFPGNLRTTCEVNLKIGWNENIGQNQSEMLKKSMEVGRKLKRIMHGVDKPSIEAMQDIIGNIYGGAAGNNENVIQNLQNVCKAKIKNDNEFQINENDAEFVRIKLLHLRNIGGFSDVENKLVPLHASQISTEQLNCLQRSGEKNIDVEYLSDKYAQSDPIELQRFVSCKYMEKLNQNMLKNLHEHLMKKTHKDVVRDYQEMSLRSFFSNQPSIATISAMPRITKQQYLKSSLSQEQDIHVTVYRAFNLMDRCSIILSEDIDEDDECTIAGFKVRPLRPFVRLSYRGTATHTATAIGCHPTWNQTVKIKTKLQPLSSLHIDVFDEYKVNLNEGNSDEEDRGKTVHYRYCNRWLGTVQVPIYTVLTMGAIRGTFKIATPPLIFGYEVPQNKGSSQSLIPEVTQLLKKETSFISLNITTSLSHLGGIQGYNQPIPNTAEDNSLIKHLNTVVTDYINDFPSRNINLTFIDCAGKNKCVTQFLQPIAMPNYEYFPKNPKSLRVESALSKSSGVSKSSSSRSSSGRRRDRDEKAPDSHRSQEESLYGGREGSWRGDSQMVKMMNAALRYVALIPTYEVTESHVVTLMGVELLKVLYGSPLDHTILLASYFLQLGVKCWVVIGQGLPRGQSSYVLTKYDLATHRDVLVTDQLFRSGSFLTKGDGYLWNVYDASSGERFELRDVSCPLKTVDYVFDNENIWLNIQSTQDCAGVSFDFTKSSNWLPVFDRTIFVMKNPPVSEAGLYSPPADVTALRDAIEAKIKQKVQKWRPQHKTIWNRYCSSLLREMLPHWEYWTFNPSEPRPPLSQKLKQLMITYKLFGFPLITPFASIKSVVRLVKATRAHATAAAGEEFAVAAAVSAYPGAVLCVTVCLISLTRL